jgi:hypothetical protein
MTSMLPSKVQVKLYARDQTDASLESYIPVFHRYIRENTFDEMVIDVADYRHVPHGPGVLVIGHASDYAIDEGEGRPGLFYNRKRDLPEGRNLVQDALGRALRAAKLLDQESDVAGPKNFGTDEILIRFPERLAVKNDDAGFGAVQSAVEAALTELLPGATYTLRREGEAREPLTVRATSA